MIDLIRIISFRFTDLIKKFGILAQLVLPRIVDPGIRKLSYYSKTPVPFFSSVLLTAWLPGAVGIFEKGFPALPPIGRIDDCGFWLS